jgi:putative membrane protein
MSEDIKSHFTKILEQAGLCVVLVVAPAAVAPAIAGAQMNPTAASAASTLSAGDRKFLNEAADGGMAEVELGKLALQKASDENVKKFGQHMVDAHSKANDELRQLAARKGVELPAAPSAKNLNLKRRLASLSGASFDKAYMIDMVADHKEDVAAFQKESNVARDPLVKSFATQTLPTLKEHLKNAQEISSKTTSALGGTAAGSIQNASGKPSPSKLASSKSSGGKTGSLLN